LNRNALVDDHELYVATPLLELIMYGLRLILADVIVYPQSGLLLFGGKGVVEPVAGHLVRPVLERQKLARVIVAQTQIAGDDDAAPDGVQKGLQERFCVQVWGLDEERGFCIVDRCEEGGVLRCSYAGIA
jgi:hypothetical protein